MNPRELPIYELEGDILAALQKQPRLVVQAPTGSGKSTQVPQMLLGHGVLGSGQVVILQPRRIAARMLAARVAAERSVKLGQEVGYQVRFENVISSSTRIRFVTEGILLRQLIQDLAAERLGLRIPALAIGRIRGRNDRVRLLLQFLLQSRILERARAGAAALQGFSPEAAVQ